MLKTTHYLLRLCVSTLIALSPYTAFTQPKEKQEPPHPEVLAIRAILQKSEKEIDLARTKVSIDHMIDPSIDIETTLKKLDTLADEVRSKLTPNLSNLAAAQLLRDHLYTSGSWNNHQPFRYDLDDPLGSNIHNKLLSTYLSTKKGNCVSMPFLFIILGQKLGIEMTASTAPEHFFVKVADGQGGYVNFEATTAGVKSNASYQRDSAITPEAITNGIYLQPLSKKETVVVMTSTLNEFYAQQNYIGNRIALSDLAMEYYPKDVTAMLHKSSAYYRIMKQRFIDKYPTLFHIPAAEGQLYNALGYQINLWRAKAEALGWKEPPPEQKAEYLKFIEQVKANPPKGEVPSCQLTSGCPR